MIARALGLDEDLAEALALLLDEEGLEAAWTRHEGLAAATWAALDAWGQGGTGIAANVADPAARSRSDGSAALQRLALMVARVAAPGATSRTAARAAVPAGR